MSQRLQPCAPVSLWHTEGGRDTLVFDDTTAINTDYRATVLQLQSGVQLQFSAALSLRWQF